jgi:EpsI family protein
MGNRRILLAAVAVLAAQFALSRTLSRTEYLPSPPPLDQFPWTLGEWSRVKDEFMEPGVLEMLSPDDSLNRTYVNASRAVEVNLFMAYYKTQHRAANAHDPKVCLPGSGWNPLISKVVEISVPARAAPVPVNYYVVGKGSGLSLVLYWYQTYKRAFAREQAARLQRIWDTVTENRTDIALVRIVVPVFKENLDAATAAGTEFMQLAYPYILRQFPPKMNETAQ